VRPPVGDCPCGLNIEDFASSYLDTDDYYQTAMDSLDDANATQQARQFGKPTNQSRTRLLRLGNPSQIFKNDSVQYK
jgi:hypothetical protein